MPNLKDRIKQVPPFDPQEEASPQAPEVPEELEEKQVEEIKTEQTIEEEQSQEQSQEQLQEQPVEEQKEEPKLPDETKERTKQEFEKLKQSNQELKETVKKYTDVLSSLQPQEVAPPNQFTPAFEPILTNQPPATYPGLTQQQIKDTFENLIDSEGYVDVNLLKEELEKQRRRAEIAEQKAREAEEAAKKAVKTVDDFQRTQKMREIHAKYPMLDPESPQFDERMWEAVRNEIVGQWVTTGTEDVDAAAKKWYDILYPMAKDKEADKKAQINAIPTQPVSTSSTFEDHQALVEATRKGKKGALAERLKRAGY
jgi:hypothetical protein